MVRKNEEPCKAVHITMPVRDIERVHQLWGNNIGFSKAISKIVRSYLNKIESKAAQQAQSVALQEEDEE